MIRFLRAAWTVQTFASHVDPLPIFFLSFPCWIEPLFLGFHFSQKKKKISSHCRVACSPFLYKTYTFLPHWQGVWPYNTLANGIWAEVTHRSPSGRGCDEHNGFAFPQPSHPCLSAMRTSPRRSLSFVLSLSCRQAEQTWWVKFSVKKTSLSCHCIPRRSGFHLLLP